MNVTKRAYWIESQPTPRLQYGHWSVAFLLWGMLATGPDLLCYQTLLQWGLAAAVALNLGCCIRQPQSGVLHHGFLLDESGHGWWQQRSFQLSSYGRLLPWGALVHAPPVGWCWLWRRDLDEISWRRLCRVLLSCQRGTKTVG